MSNDFSTLKQGFEDFRRNALSEFTPPKILNGLEGAYMAGSQAAIVLMTEALGIDPATAPQEVVVLFAECQGYFMVKRAEATSRIEEKKDGKATRSKKD
jgi:hypothetical protein